MNTLKPMGRPNNSGLSLKLLGHREYHRQLTALRTGQPLQEIYPRQDEVALKEWLIIMADQFKITANGVRMKIKRHKLAMPPARKVNQRVIFVTAKKGDR